MRYESDERDLFCGADIGSKRRTDDELAAWAKRDCDDWRVLVTQTNRARNGHDVAVAMRENVRRQRTTIEILVQFARSHPDLHDAAQLGLGKDGQISWREKHPNRTSLPAEVRAIEQQLNLCLGSVGSKAQDQMVAVLRKYHDDSEVLSASRELHEMWTDHDRKLLQVLR